MSIETMLFDQDYVTEMYEHELIEQGRIEGKVEGKSEGIEIGTINTLNNLVKDGLLTKEEARKLLKKYNIIKNYKGKVMNIEKCDVYNSKIVK